MPSVVLADTVPITVPAFTGMNFPFCSFRVRHEHPRVGRREIHAALDERGLRAREVEAAARAAHPAGRTHRDLERLHGLRVVVLKRPHLDRLLRLARLERDDLIRSDIVPSGHRRPVARPPAHRHTIRHRGRHRDRGTPRGSLADRVRHRRERDRHRPLVGDHGRCRRPVHDHRAGTGRAGEREHHGLALVQDPVIERLERDPGSAFALRHRRLAGERRVVLARHGGARDGVPDGHGPGGGAALHRHLEVAGRALGHRASGRRGERHFERVGRRRGVGSGRVRGTGTHRQSERGCQNREDPGDRARPC